MPPGGTEARVRHMGLLASIRHGELCSSELGELIDEAAGKVSSGSDDEALVREARRERDRAVRLSSDLVRKTAEAVGRGQKFWIEARKKNDFLHFVPALKEIVFLKKEHAHALSDSGAKFVYDVLLDEYEPGATVVQLDQLIGSTANHAKKLYEGVCLSEPNTDLRFPSDSLKAQKIFCRRILEWIGFDFNGGRLDESVHPFTSSFDTRDVRLTTHYDPDCLTRAALSTLHEGGHGLYEQGLCREHSSTPLGQSLSLGIHESQSRFWENQVGRRMAFWCFAQADLKEIFGPALVGVNPEHLYNAVNKVKASPVRINADEVTYNLHIALRYELEKGLLDGALAVEDLEGAWNEEMQKLLGIRPTDPRQGVLQDIHWSMGLFGYFPTYLLGNLYAAQWAWAMEKELGTLDELIENGGFLEIKDWFRRNIHVHGRRWSTDEITRRATGSSLDSSFFKDYIEKKHSELCRVGF